MTKRPASYTVDPSGQQYDEFGNVTYLDAAPQKDRRGLLLAAAAAYTVYRFNERAYRYIDGRGRFVSNAAVRAELDKALRDSQLRMRTFSGQLQSGKLSLADWQVGMMKEIKNTHLASAALAKGGWAQMTPADYGRVGAEVQKQYAYLDNFARQIASGEQRLDGFFLRRANMYSEAGRATYHEAERREQSLRGKTEERNILEPTARHCEGCLAETARGWVTIGELARVGSRDCLTRCRCRIEYR